MCRGQGAGVGAGFGMKNIVSNSIAKLEDVTGPGSGVASERKAASHPSGQRFEAHRPHYLGSIASNCALGMRLRRQ